MKTMILGTTAFTGLAARVRDLEVSCPHCGGKFEIQPDDLSAEALARPNPPRVSKYEDITSEGNCHVLRLDDDPNYGLSPGHCPTPGCGRRLPFVCARV